MGSGRAAWFPTLMVIVLSCLYSRVLCGQFDNNVVDSVLQQTFACHNNPGLAVSVVKDGKVIFSKGYGVTDIDSKLPVDENTIFGIASLSKAFTATLLVKLLYLNNLTVESRVGDVLGDKFRMPDNFRTSETTFADLLAHRTGISPNNYIRFDDNLTRASLLDRVQFLPSPAEFRVKYYYNNLMYGLATRLTELLGQATWETLTRAHLYSPLGMANSTFATEADFSQPQVATAYEEADGGGMTRVSPEFSKRWAMLGGSGAVMSTAADMARWMTFHLTGGQGQVMPGDQLAQVHQGRFLTSSSASRDTRLPQFPVTASEDVYALGFKRGFYRGYEKLAHTGTTLGYRAMMTLLPGEKVGVFTAMSGGDDGYVYRVPLHMYLLDAALGLQPWLNTSTICSYPAPWKTPRKPRAPIKLDHSFTFGRNVSEYEGVYHNQAYGRLSVSFNQSLASLVLTYGWANWRLVHIDGEKFYGDGLGIVDIFDVSLVQFLASPDGARIAKVEATAFNTAVPPVFDRVANPSGSLVG